MRQPTTGNLVRSAARRVRLDSPTTGSMRSRALLSTVGVGVQGGLRFTSSVLVGRLGGAALLGVVNSAISTAMFLALLWPTSSGSAASKFVARARGAEQWEEVAAVAAHLGRRTMGVTVLLALLGVLAWVTVGHGDLTGGLCVGALVLGYSGYSFVRGVQFGAGQVQRATVWDVLSSAVGLVGLLTALVVGARGPALLLPLAVGYSVYAAAGWPRGAHGRLRPHCAVSWTTSCPGGRGDRGQYRLPAAVHGRRPQCRHGAARRAVRLRADPGHAGVAAGRVDEPGPLPGHGRVLGQG